MHFSYPSIFIIWCRSMAWSLVNGKNCTSKIFVLQANALHAIYDAMNNLTYNDHTNTYFKCDKILKLADQYNL